MMMPMRLHASSINVNDEACCANNDDKTDPKDESSPNDTIDDAANVTDNGHASYINVNDEESSTNNNHEKPYPKNYNSNIKRCFPGCASTSKDKSIKWHGMIKIHLIHINLTLVLASLKITTLGAKLGLF